MPGLLSGSRLNSSGPLGYANLTNVQYQLGPTPTTSTGYTLVANSGSQVTFVSSLGNLEFTNGKVYSLLPDGNITLLGTGTTGIVYITGNVVNTGTSTGALVVHGGVGIANGLHTGEDIYINGLRVGQGRNPNQNNIVITGDPFSKVNFTDGKADGENSISIGWGALQELYTGGASGAVNSIAIGRYALSTGTYLTNTIAIGDSSLYTAGTIPQVLIGNITSLAVGSTTVVTVPNHGLSTGTEIAIYGTVGTVNGTLNGNYFRAKSLTTDTFSLFSQGDVNCTGTPVSTQGSTYVNSGTVFRVISNIDNIALGTNAGNSIYDGDQNIFVGHGAASGFTTGSYNVFIGPSVAYNMTKGNNNISIAGSNLVDGLDNQINIGAVFYYNGSGYLELNADVGVGLGDDSTSTTSGAFNVYGGAGLSGSLFVGANLNATGTGTVTLSPIGTVVINPSVTGHIDNMVIGAATPKNANLLSTTATNITVTDATPSINQTSGAVTVAGGVGVQGSIYSADGNPQENYKLYSPQVTVSTTVPLLPNIGDFWINSNTLAEYQYILDGTNYFWVQIAQL